MRDLEFGINKRLIAFTQNIYAKIATAIYMCIEWGRGAVAVCLVPSALNTGAILIFPRATKYRGDRHGAERNTKKPRRRGGAKARESNPPDASRQPRWTSAERADAHSQQTDGHMCRCADVSA